MSAALYEQIHAEVSGHLNAEDAEILAEALAFMSPDRVKRLFAVVDNYEPSESEQGLIPIPGGYNEQ
jgi:hypothetical protein